MDKTSDSKEFKFKKNIEVNVYYDKLDKLNTEYNKKSDMADIMRITEDMDAIINDIYSLLHFFIVCVDNPKETSDSLRIETDINNFNELQHRLDTAIQKLSNYSLEKQCEEFIKLVLAFEKIENGMKDRSMFVRKIKKI